MSTINQKRKIRFFYSLYLLITSLLIVFFGWGLIKEIINRQQINHQIANYQKKIEKLKQENELIKQKIASWENDLTLEMAARTKLGLQKPGEKAIFIDRNLLNNQPVVAIKTNQEIVQLIDDNKSDKTIPKPLKWLKRFLK